MGSEQSQETRSTRDALQQEMHLLQRCAHSKRCAEGGFADHAHFWTFCYALGKPAAAEFAGVGVGILEEPVAVGVLELAPGVPRGALAGACFPAPSIILAAVCRRPWVGEPMPKIFFSCSAFTFAASCSRYDFGFVLCACCDFSISACLSVLGGLPFRSSFSSTFVFGGATELMATLEVFAKLCRFC